VFGVYNADTDKKVCELTTGTDGKASTELPQGSFYLKELIAPSGYQLVTDEISFTIKPTETVTLTVENPKIPEEPKPGKLILTKEAEDTGKRLSGAVFGVYAADTDKKQGEITTGRDGTASIELPAGRYYLLEKTAPQGFQKSGDKVYFRIKSGETIEITVENKAVPSTTPTADKPKTGTLELLKSAEGTGKRLSGAVFGVYSVDGNKKQGEITTDKNGMATIELAGGDFYLKELTPPTGYIVEKDKIPFIISVGKTVLVEVTNMRETVTIDDGKTPQGSITIPKTGGDFPAMSYTISAFCLTLAAFCGAVLLKRRRGIATTK
jgi:uncharacterized surface anchored protein